MTTKKITADQVAAAASIHVMSSAPAQSAKYNSLIAAHTKSIAVAQAAANGGALPGSSVSTYQKSLSPTAVQTLVDTFEASLIDAHPVVTQADAANVNAAVAAYLALLQA